jgi:hypothetical protein
MPIIRYEKYWECQVNYSKTEQCNPPERTPRQDKERTPMELFMRHLVYDVLSKKTIDKVLKLIRKLDWDDILVTRALHKLFTKPWKIKYGNISLLAMLTYDLQRYHPAFSIAVVDQVLEDIRRGLEQNLYSTNQRRVATVKYLGELYIYRLFSSGIIFDTLWSMVTFGHRMPHLLLFTLLQTYKLLHLQPMDDLCRNRLVQSICRTISFVYGLFVFFSTLVACALTMERRRRNWTTF